MLWQANLAVRVTLPVRQLLQSALPGFVCHVNGEWTSDVRVCSLDRFAVDLLGAYRPSAWTLDVECISGVEFLPTEFPNDGSLECESVQQFTITEDFLNPVVVSDANEVLPFPSAPIWWQSSEWWFRVLPQTAPPVSNHLQTLYQGYLCTDLLTTMVCRINQLLDCYTCTEIVCNE